LQLSRDTRGAGLIEFAIGLPVLLVMMLGIVDVATCYSAQFTLEQAAARSLERVQVTGGLTEQALVRAEAASAAGVPLTNVTVEDWLECQGVRQAASVVICPTGQNTSRYLQVTINSSYVPYFAYSPLGTRQADGSIALSASSALRIS
jgi:Flp pilus assembly protein TadG